MYSLKELYKFGNGPSSSHTIGPKKAATLFLNKYPDARFIRVELYASLALTGKGHLTDYIIEQVLCNIPHEIVFDKKTAVPHPNTMKFIAKFDDKDEEEMTIYSVGGGSIRADGEPMLEGVKVYPHHTLKEIKRYCGENNISYAEYVYSCEEDIKPYLNQVYEKMLKSVENGLEREGLIHGSLRISRKAKNLYSFSGDESLEFKNKRLITAYAYAVAEENATGGEIVTSPTCGASGVIPACLRRVVDENKYDKEKLIDALAVAGLFGNLVKTNASISGAEAGCQAEIGTACSMAAAFLAHVYGLNLNEIEQAAEIALEHHLGLTCDPIKGYVQIPCIERNAVAALRAFDAAFMASVLHANDTKISFDLVCKTMLETGRDLGEHYRETSIGGLASHFKGEDNEN